MNSTFPHHIFTRSFGIFLGIFWMMCLCIVIVYTSLTHGNMRSDRIIFQSKDSADFILIEATRNERLWMYYDHHYTLLVAHNEKYTKKLIEFSSLSPNIQTKEYLSALTDIQDFEVTSRIISWSITLNETSLSFSSSLLHGWLTTKTDPLYIRYMSAGEGTLGYADSSISHPAYVFIDTIVSQDSSHAYLSVGTKIEWYAGGFWDKDWDFYYYDKSVIIERGQWETYIPHQYILHRDSWGRYSRDEVFGFERKSSQNWDIILWNTTFWIGPIDSSRAFIWNDAYYLYQNDSFRGFMNFFKN